MSNSPPPHVDAFFEACGRGEVEVLRGLLASEPDLVRVDKPGGPHAGWTGLHSAAQRGHLDAVRLLLGHGADPNAREEGDNTYPLHWAAANRHLEIVRALLDAGGDPHGLGDVHELDAIGWATFFHPQSGDTWPDVATLLVERGARHHIISAIAVGDLSLIRKVVEQNPAALGRRMSRFEQYLTPLHLALSRGRHDILDLLVELGADLDAKDESGQTALAVAIARGDRPAVNRLQAAGARPPDTIDAPTLKEGMARMADAILKGVPMIYVIADMFYGARQFGIRDLNGYLLYFIQTLERQAQ